MSERRVPFLLWVLTFPIVQLLAFVAVLALDPAGFDPCGPEGPGPRIVQWAVVMVPNAVLVGAALWWLRGWLLAAAVLAMVVAGLGWAWLLLDGSQYCA